MGLVAEAARPLSSPQIDIVSANLGTAYQKLKRVGMDASPGRRSLSWRLRGFLTGFTPNIRPRIR